MSDEDMRAVALDWLETSDNADTKALRGVTLEIIRDLRAKVEKEHECAEELKEGLVKQYGDFAKDMDAKDAEVRKLTLQSDELKAAWASDLRWAMNKNAALILALRHEVFGNAPCSPDCEPGGWRKCTGCDKRAKDAIRSPIADRGDEKPIRSMDEFKARYYPDDANCKHDDLKVVRRCVRCGKDQD